MAFIYCLGVSRNVKSHQIEASLFDSTIESYPCVAIRITKYK